MLHKRSIKSFLVGLITKKLPDATPESTWKYPATSNNSFLHSIYDTNYYNSNCTIFTFKNGNVSKPAALLYVNHEFMLDKNNKKKIYDLSYYWKESQTTGEIIVFIPNEKNKLELEAIFGNLQEAI